MIAGRSAMHQHRHAGFTIVELVTALAVIALLAAMAVPTMRSVVENGRIRTAGNSIQNGLALARTEAVRSNIQVEFALTANGWEVRRAADGVVLQQAAGMEVSGSGLTLDVDPEGADRITFNSFGRRNAVNMSDDTLPMERIDIRAPNPSAMSKPLAIQLLPSGVTRLCDPSAAADQPRACL
jgi:type IV fimbrial biogenesis protein FimT